MTTSQHTFDQVRSLLSKLDNDIDAARRRRMRTDEPTGHIPRPEPAPAATFTSSAPAAERDPGQSGYGVARPLRRDRED